MATSPSEDHTDSSWQENRYTDRRNESNVLIQFQKYHNPAQNLELEYH